jgi:HK97 gp10 family phage protein|nr:MAG TPA: hypothetical protein [Caudoviricetes sp.]
MSFHSTNDFDGINDLINDLSKYVQSASNPVEILEVGAKEFVKDLLKLTKPVSKIKKSGYTHLIDTFCYAKTNNNEIEVGWGKYYGRMVEDGTKKTHSQAHLKPTFNKNRDKYYQKMLEKFKK